MIAFSENFEVTTSVEMMTVHTVNGATPIFWVRATISSGAFYLKLDHSYKTEEREKIAELAELVKRQCVRTAEFNEQYWRVV